MYYNRTAQLPNKGQLGAKVLIEKLNKNSQNYREEIRTLFGFANWQNKVLISL